MFLVKDIEQLYDARLKQKQAKLKRAAAAAAASNKNQQSAEASSQVTSFNKHTAWV